MSAPDTPHGVIARAIRTLNPFEEAPAIGDWLVCPSGHVLAQYQRKERLQFNDWGRFSGTVISVQFGRRVISCGICGEEAHTSLEPFACQVVSDKAVNQAVNLIG